MEVSLNWISEISIEHIRNILISIPGIFLTGFSFYFAYKKICNKVLASYLIKFSKTTEKSIYDLELINEKNKPIVIYSIHAVINKDIVIKLDEYKVPINVKTTRSNTNKQLLGVQLCI